MPLRAPMLVAALALLWGSGFFWIKLALAGLSPFQLTFARLALGAAVLGLIVAVRRVALPRGRAMWGYLAVAALISNAVPYTLFAIVEQTVPSILAGIVNATTPLWTAVLAYAAGSDTAFTVRRIAGLAVGFTGALILLSPWNASDLGSTLGILACLGAAVSYGLSYVYQARYVTNRGFPPLVLAFGQLCASTVLLALTLPVTRGPRASADGHGGARDPCARRPWHGRRLRHQLRPHRHRGPHRCERRHLPRARCRCGPGRRLPRRTHWARPADRRRSRPVRRRHCPSLGSTRLAPAIGHPRPGSRHQPAEQPS